MDDTTVAALIAAAGANVAAASAWVVVENGRMRSGGFVGGRPPKLSFMTRRRLRKEAEVAHERNLRKKAEIRAQLGPPIEPSKYRLR